MSNPLELESLRARLLALAEQAVDFTAYLDSAGAIRWMSDSFLAFTGGSLKGLFSLPLIDLISSTERPSFAAALEAVQGKSQRVDLLLNLTSKEGVPTKITARLIKISGDSGQLLFTATRFDSKLHTNSDSDRHAQDALTGLASRSSFLTQLKEALMGDPFALLIINLDRFKRINESMGTHNGDALLKAASKRLAHSIRDSDVLARLSADEFALILKKVSDQDLIGDLASRLLTLLGQPFDLDGERIRLSASIGVAMYPDHGASEELLIRAAELAVEKVKARGGNQWSQDTGSHKASRPGLTLETSLHEAVEQGQLSLHYQPIVDQSGRLAGAEALMRWHHPDKGFIGPADFIPAAEACGLIYLLGTWSLRLACAQAARWSNSDLYVSVNVSPKQFLKEGFEDAVKSALAESNLDPKRLMLEITEGVLMLDPGYSKSLLERLKKLGIKVAVDDFGTGYSSLAYLKSLPVSALKVDRSFVMGLPGDSKDYAIVASILSMTNQLGLFSVIEGVETEEQAAAVKELGCTYMQGWLYGKPLSAEEFELKFLKG
jgi:diguanylate cyclase